MATEVVEERKRSAANPDTTKILNELLANEVWLEQVSVKKYTLDIYRTCLVLGSERLKGHFPLLAETKRPPKENFPFAIRAAEILILNERFLAAKTFGQKTKMGKFHHYISAEMATEIVTVVHLFWDIYKLYGGPVYPFHCTYRP